MNMTKAVNISSLEKGTGITWTEWLNYLEGIGAKNLPHKYIALQVQNKLRASLDNPGWWAQSVTVAYEQHIGRRKPGQRNDGTYEASVSKTVNTSLDDIFQKWLNKSANQKEFAGIAIAAPATTTSTDKRRHWSVNLTDGSRINADTDNYAAGKTRIAVTHARLGSQADVGRWRAYWRDVLENL